MNVFSPKSIGRSFCGRTWAIALALGLPLMAHFPDAFADSAGTVKTSKGAATIERNGQKLAASVGTSVESGDRIMTGSDAAVGITLRDNTMLSAGPNSTLDLNKYAFNTTTHMGELDTTVKRGSLAVISGKLAKANPERVKFSTSNMTLGVRGTEFVIEAGQEK